MRPWALVLSVFSAACGYVEFGVDRQPITDGGAADPDGDSGVVGSMDSGALDSGQPLVDAGPCTPIPEPPYPAAWPFPRTRAAYEAEFHGAMPDRATCSLAACHGAPPQPPLIPMNATDLDTPATLSAAIDQLWGVSIPKAQATPPSPETTLKWNHGPRTPPSPSYALTPGQLAFIDRYVERAGACRWKGVVPGAGQCPPPFGEADLAYCAP